MGRYGLDVPVLAVLRAENGEKEWPVARPAPRAPAERVGAALEAALVAAAAGEGG